MCNKEDGIIRSTNEDVIKTSIVNLEKKKVNYDRYNKKTK